jgi:hypothetical protein
MEGSEIRTLMLRREKSEFCFYVVCSRYDFRLWSVSGSKGVQDERCHSYLQSFFLALREKPNSRPFQNPLPKYTTIYCIFQIGSLNSLKHTYITGGLSDHH